MNGDEGHGRSTANTSSRSLLIDLVPPRLYIFVPALMSVGFAFWLTALVRDQLRRRRTMSLERRAEVAGAAAAAVLVGQEPVNAASLDRPRDRRLHLLLALPLLAFGVYILLGSVANYLRPGGYVGEIGWLLALSLLLSVAFGASGVVLATVAFQWPDLPPVVRRLVSRTPIIGPLPDDGDYRRPSRRLIGALAVTGGSAALLAMAVGSSRGVLARLDEPLLDAVTDAGWLDRVSDIDLVGSSTFAVVAAALLGLASLRCRVLVLAYPVAFASAFITSNLLKAVVERERPPEGPFGGWSSTRSRVATRHDDPAGRAPAPDCGGGAPLDPLHPVAAMDRRQRHRRRGAAPDVTRSRTGRPTWSVAS